MWKHAIISTIKGRIEIGTVLTDRQKGRDEVVARRDVTFNPILGCGFGNFLRIFPKVPQDSREFNCWNEKFTHAHNDYVEGFMELGYLGIISLLAVILNFFYRFLNAVKDKELVLYFCVVLAYLLNATGNFLSQLAISGILLVIFWGLFEGEIKERKYALPSLVVYPRGR